MHPASTNKPTQAQLVFPLIEALQEMGGRGRAKDVGMALASRFRLPRNVLAETVTTGDGQVVNLWQRHVRFARQKAAAMGYLASAGTGVWQVTDEGQTGMANASAAIRVIVFVDPKTNEPRSATIDLNVGLPSVHTLHCADSRDLSWIDDGQIPLIVSSAPYANLVEYETAPGQLGEIESYEEFLRQLDAIWRECYRVLEPGGRLACNVGDVLRSRKAHGRHHVLPLHADILVRSRNIGFDALTGVMWQKLTNCRYEEGAGGVLGRPGMPNQVIKSELEHILLLRKPGPYRSPTPAQQEASRISKQEHSDWYRPIWEIPGAKAHKNHPAPFPVSIPYRLIRMFSFAGDTVLDPFSGSGTTTLAAMKAGRNSVGVEVAPSYFRSSVERLSKEAAALAA
ncbi:site-specific DNA-methyltransferase [Microvirga sp.]|uniref:site-specific DNA-methyltransferase n=1 Tax=Microvirga sp. TaxID=1873136 RepID=UPI002484BFB4|nr:site-specific DNA-methyltransferase [Microvirga sp.]